MSVVESIAQAREFATLPAIATRVLRMLEQEDVNVRELTEIVEFDPSLSVKLLRIANSPLYGSRANISSIQQAIMMIGFNKLTNIVLGISIFSKFWFSTKKGSADLMNKFWWHSSSTGTIAKSLISKINRNYNENEFIGGLIYQIGKLAMIQYDLEKYMQVIELVEKGGLEDVNAESIVFGINHINVNEQLANQWKLPGELKTIITSYNNPSQLGEHRELVAAVSLAGMLCEFNGAPFYKGLKNTNLTKEESWVILCEISKDFREKGFDFVTKDLDEEFNKSSEFLSAVK